MLTLYNQLLGHVLHRLFLEKNQAVVQFFCCRWVRRRICVIQIRHFFYTRYIQLLCVFLLLLPLLPFADPYKHID